MKRRLEGVSGCSLGLPGHFLAAFGTPNLQKSTQMEVLSGAWKVLEALDGILGGSCGLIAALGVLMGGPKCPNPQKP